MPTLKIPKAVPGWSFVIVTDGKEPLIGKLVSSIEREFKDTPAEITIVGPKTTRFGAKLSIPTKLIHFEDDPDKPGWITRKKNLGVLVSTYDKVCVCHDYIELDEGFRQGFEDFGEDWDVGTTRVYFKDGRRSRDWVTFDFPQVGQALLPYDKNYSEFQYLNGTFFFVKRDFYLYNPLDDRRRWGQAEDVEWSVRIRQKTKFSLNQFSSVHFNREKPDDEPPYSKQWRASTQRLEQMIGLKN